MPLPKIATPTYELELPSTEQPVNYRPFLVKEEKLLLLATETGEQADLITAIKDIIAACTDIKDIEKLSTFDIEFVFLQIRTKSVGESVDLSVTCPDDGETAVAVSIPLSEIKVQKTKGHKKDIKLTEEVMISMGYPSLDTFVKMNFTDEEVNVEQIFEMAASCVQSITDVEEVHDCTSMDKSEIMEFFNQLSSKQFAFIQDFFETMPKLTHTVKVTNPKTKVENEVVLEGLASFFA